MTLDDVRYFSHDRIAHAKEYATAKRVELLSSQSLDDVSEFERRLASVASHKDNIEHQMQAGNFVCELQIFDMLRKSGRAAHWCPESNKKGVRAPDIYYEQRGRKIPVEVKMLGLDAVEGYALRSHDPAGYSGAIDTGYFEGCKKKLDSFFSDVQTKVDHYNQVAGLPGEFYLFFFPSQHIRFRDGEDGMPLMEDRIKEHAKNNLAAHIDFKVINVLNAYDYLEL